MPLSDSLTKDFENSGLKEPSEKESISMVGPSRPSRPRSIPIAIASASTAQTDDDDSNDNYSSYENSDHGGSIESVPYTSDLSLNMYNLRISDKLNHNNSTRNSMAQSMPHPRAPFLSARNFSGDRFSSIPPIRLPESAEASDCSSFDHENTEQPMGSLRESQFYLNYKTRFNGNSINEENSNVKATTSFATNAATNDKLIYPRSVPTRKEIDREWVAKRWAEQRYHFRKHQKQMQRSQGDTNPRSFSEASHYLEDTNPFRIGDNDFHDTNDETNIPRSIYTTDPSSYHSRINNEKILLQQTNEVDVNGYDGTTSPRTAFEMLGSSKNSSNGLMSSIPVQRTEHENELLHEQKCTHAKKDEVPSDDESANDPDTFEAFNIDME